MTPRLSSEPSLQKSRIPPTPVARAPDVKDLLHLFDSSWFGDVDVHFPPDFVVHEQAPLGRHAGPQSFHTESSSDSDSLPASLYFEGNSPVPQKSSDSRHISEEPRSFLLRMHALLSPFDSQVESQSVPADAVQPGLGTWANRQRVFLQESAEKEPGNYVQNIDESGPSGVQYFNSDGATPGAQDHNPVEDVASAGTYTADMHDAWRWRFTRKWQMEQLRPQIETTPSKDAEDDDWTTALEYISTAAGGANLQFGRPSLDQSASFEGLSQSFSILLAEDASLPRDDSLRGRGASGNPSTPLATQRIVRTVKKAEELIACQEEIERQVAARWENAESQEPWAAQGIPAVAIDSWGSFPFILARLVDGGRQKLLVRGRNRSSEQQAAKVLEKEVTQEATKRKLPRPRVEMLGSGTIEWSNELDRCLTISGTTLYMALDGKLRTVEDVGRVAGVLTQSGLTARRTIVVVPPPVSARRQS